MDKIAYNKNRHSCYYLKYHLVVCIKYRHPVLDNDELKDELISLTNDIFETEWHCRLDSVNTDRDHIHIMFSAPPQVQLSKLVNNFKTVSSRMLRKHHSEYLKQYFWKNYFWSDSYFIGTVSDVTETVVRQYILDQGKNKKEDH